MKIFEGNIDEYSSTQEVTSEELDTNYDNTMISKQNETLEDDFEIIEHEYEFPTNNNGKFSNERNWNSIRENKRDIRVEMNSGKLSLFMNNLLLHILLCVSSVLPGDYMYTID